MDGMFWMWYSMFCMKTKDIILMSLVHFSTGWLHPARCWLCWTCLGFAQNHSTPHWRLGYVICFSMDFVMLDLLTIIIVHKPRNFCVMVSFCSFKVMDMHLMGLWYPLSNVMLSFFLVWIVSDVMVYP